MAQTYTIGNDTIYKMNGNYYFIYYNDTTTLIDSSVLTVKFNSGVSESERSGFSDDFQLTWLGESVGGFNYYQLPQQSFFISKCDSINDHSDVEYIEINIFFEVHSYEPYEGYEPYDPDDPEIDDQWYLNNIKVYDPYFEEYVAWDLTRGSEEIIVAVIDFGLNWEHDEFEPKTAEGKIAQVYQNPVDTWDPWYDPDKGNDIDDDGNGYTDDFMGWDFYEVNTGSSVTSDNDTRPLSPSDYGHGIAVSGIISAKTNNDEDMAGIAGGDFILGKGGVKILPIKCGDFIYIPGGVTDFISSYEIPDAIEYAVDNGAKIINMSFGNLSDKNKRAIKAALLDAYENNVLLVASSGNDNIDVDFPASDQYVLGVGGTDQLDERGEWVDGDGNEYGANYGVELEISAPCVDITTLTNTNTDEWYGTSFSSPMVCAAAALMLSINPTLTNVELRTILNQTADKTGGYNYNWDASNPGHSEELGFGRLNVYEAVCEASVTMPDIIVENDDTWEETIISRNDIIIQPGATLTIKGTVFMGYNAKIIVKQGAQLIVDHGKITNFPFCGEENNRWECIEVWGDENEHQYTLNGENKQGKLVLKSATIEKAQVAVRLFDNSDWSTTGGVVLADSSLFINNQRAATFFPFKNIFLGEEYDYNSRFTNCTFTVDENYISVESTFKGYHLYLQGVKGIGINGCIFENDLDSDPSGRAIFSNDAGFIIKGACWESDIQPCPQGEYHPTTFTNFNRAIESANSGSALYRIYIRESEFLLNGYGIHFSGVNDALVVGNKFVPGKTEDCEYDAGIGIFLDNCKRFAIENNDFLLETNPLPLHYVGIHTKNTNNKFDEIYNNDFVEMTEGNRAEGKNWRNQNWEGLAYYCNTNHNNRWDFYVDGDASGHTGIQKNQGGFNYSAGNTFSPDAIGHFDNWGGYEIDYYYNLLSNPEIPDANKMYRVQPMPIRETNYCPDHYSGGDVSLSSSEHQAKSAAFSTASNTYDSLFSVYVSTTDSATRSQLESQMSHQNMLLSRAAYAIIKSEMADSVTHVSNINQWLLNLDNYPSDQSRVDLLIQEGNYTDAISLLDSLEDKYSLSTFDSLEYEYYLELKVAQTIWLSNTRTIFELTSSEIAQLTNIANNSYGLAGAQARGILSFAYDSIFTHCYSLPDTTQKSSKADIQLENETTPIKLTVKPNPARDKMTVEYELPFAVESATFSIYSPVGKLIVSIPLQYNQGEYQLDCSAYRPGVYLYTLNCKGGAKTGKIIVIE